MSTEPIRVLLADDHGILRDGIRGLVNSQDDMVVVGEVGDASEVVSAARETGANVIVLDLTMPGGGGLGALRELRTSEVEANVLVLTMHEEPAYLQQAIAEGALGYVVKRVVGTQLLYAIRAVAEGRSHIDAHLSQDDLLRLLGANSRPSGGAKGDKPQSVSLAMLSPREQQVLRFIASGYTNQDTADELDLSVKTVEGYRARLTRKLGAKGRADLVRHALKFGLLNS